MSAISRLSAQWALQSLTQKMYVHYVNDVPHYTFHYEGTNDTGEDGQRSRSPDAITSYA